LVRGFVVQLQKIEGLAGMRFRFLSVASLVLANLTACGVGRAASTIQFAEEGAWIGSMTSISTGKATPVYGFILGTGEYLFITDTANPEITFGTSKIAGETILSTDMKAYDPHQGTIVNGWFTGTLTSRQSMSIQFSSNNSGAMSSGSFAFDGRYKVPTSLTIITGDYKNPNLLDGSSTHSHTFDADAISKADSAECAFKRLLIIKIAPKISITCR
jgi:hypothetical protein